MSKALRQMNESKSGDSSLHDWFSKSRSSDGTPGWVQLGGKYAGKPCAKQPGQTTKPKCGSSKMKRNLNKDEEQAAFRRKNRQDPNPDRKGKAINVKTEETVIEGKGEKDACYHKVKSRYKVWPSAYASGALVKCRKKGAKNWGNKTEEYDFSNWRDDFQPVEIETVDLILPDPIKKEGYEPGDVDQKVGAVTAIPKKERDAARERILAKAKKRREEREKLKEENAGCKIKKISKEDAIKQQLKKQDEQPLTQNQKEFSIARVHPANEELSNWRNDIGEGAAWTKKSGKDPEGGLNEKGRKSYEKENPGSDLKRPSKEVGNPRRKSFCARMKGMKKKLTSSKTANDPDSRINKSLRAWNC